MVYVTIMVVMYKEVGGGYSFLTASTKRKQTKLRLNL